MDVESIGTFPIYKDMILLGLRCEKVTKKLSWDWIGGRIEESDDGLLGAYEREVKEECDIAAGSIIVKSTNFSNKIVCLNTTNSKHIVVYKCVITDKSELDNSLLLERPIIPNTSYHVSYRWITKSEFEFLVKGNQIDGYYLRGFIVHISEKLISFLFE